MTTIENLFNLHGITNIVTLASSPTSLYLPTKIPIVVLVFWGAHSEQIALVECMSLQPSENPFTCTISSTCFNSDLQSHSLYTNHYSLKDEVLNVR